MDSLTSPTRAMKSAAMTSPPVPEETPGLMPAQNIRQWDRASRQHQVSPSWSSRLRRALIFMATLALTSVASYEMYRVLSVRTMTPLQVMLLVVFTITFVWIALPFVCGLAGLLTLWRGRSASGIPLPPEQARLTTHTALLMPIYNEEPSRVFAGFQAIYEALQARGVLAHFAFFLLSDTTDPEVWLEEERCFRELRHRTGDAERIFYRHRPKNIRRKAGNISDFCERWGARYDHMVILDADSLMSGDALVRLVAAMEAAPRAGLIQTLPLMINRNTLFARAQQFAARVYGPVIAAGVASWHRGDSSYWGHNAIIRTKAFMEHAGLPDLPGKPPLGGPILSHDFVEAALLRRAGWQIYLVPEIAGSYEESPPSLLDFAERDRRWCQGNLQHSRLLTARGFYWLSRLHLVLGIMSYLASPIWLIFMMLGLLLALQAYFLRPEYFPQPFALFPTWPVFDAQRAVRLFLGTMGVLIAPKLFGYALLCKDADLARSCGGRLRAGISVLIETLFSALIAPVLMLLQTSVVVGILTGRDVGWKAQRRDDGRISWGAIWRRHLTHTLVGVALGGAAYMVSPHFLFWMSPVILGLLLAMPVSAATGSQWLGRALRRLGLFLTPEESAPPPVVQRANELRQAFAAQRPEMTEALTRLATDPDLRLTHLTMLPARAERRRGDYDVDLLVGLAKLDDAASLEEAAALLANREKLAVLSTRSGLERLCQLASEGKSKVG